MKKILIIVIVLLSTVQVFSQSFRNIEYHSSDELIEILTSEGYGDPEILSNIKGTKLFKLMIFYNSLNEDKKYYRVFILVNKNWATDKYAIWDLDRKTENINFDNDIIKSTINYGKISPTTSRIVLIFENGERGTIDFSFNHTENIFSWIYAGDNNERYRNRETHIINLK